MIELSYSTLAGQPQYEIRKNGALLATYASLETMRDGLAVILETTECYLKSN